MQPVVANKRVNDEKLLFTLSGVNTSIANSIRRCILSDIECVVFKTFPHAENKANIIKNTSRHTNEILKQRLSCVPIHLDVTAPYESLIVEVNVTNTTDQTIYVTTKDFKIKEKTTEKYISESERDKIFPPNTITGDYIMFARLRPSGETKKGEGESLSFTAEMNIATAKEDGMFSVASISSYTNTIDTAKLDTAWKDKQSALAANTDDVMTETELAKYKENWLLLDGLRQFKDNSFDFVIETIGVYSNETLVIRSCDAMLKKIEQLNHEIQTKTVTINKSETTIDNCYDLVLKNEDYSLGKVIEYILHVNYYEGDKILTFCGFKKFHPHDIDSIIRIAFKADEEMASIHDYLIATCNQASQIYEKIKTNFNDATI
tara:strand:+ start:515 stop:1642 length:1128 start_codon:yes stop_codon:yes gene_type:complete